MAEDASTASVAGDDKDVGANGVSDGSAPAAAAASGDAASGDAAAGAKADAKDGKTADAESSDANTDAEIEAMRKRVKEMEDEAKKIDDLQASADKSLKPKTAPAAPAGPEVDARSVYVGNVDYSTTPEELQEFFSSCGTVNRITILCDKFTGQPKGYAYVEFKDVDSIQNALLLNDSEFKGRPLKVTEKRTNVPGMGAHQRGRPRGRAPRGGASFRSPTRGAPYGGYPSYGAAPRGRFRHRRFTSPYAR